MSRHDLDAAPDTIHWGHFDARLRPVLTIASGDVVRVSSVNGVADILADCPFDILPQHRAILDRCTPDMGRHIITGPIAVQGALPGDVLEVSMKQSTSLCPGGSTPRGRAWARCRTASQTSVPTSMRSTLRHGRQFAVRPASRPCAILRIMAVAPPLAWGRVSAMEPRANGGNIDCRELQAGSRLFLPVFVEGALFSARRRSRGPG